MDTDEGGWRMTIVGLVARPTPDPSREGNPRSAGEYAPRFDVSPPGRGQGWIRSILQTALLTVVALATTGCIAPKLPPANLSSPGWVVRDVPALWRPSSEAEEIAGEILWARNSDAAALFVQFSKGGLPILVAREEPAGWTLSSSLRKGTYGGRGSGPRQVPWFQLSTMPPARVAAPWQVDTTAGDRWILSNPRTGERLEGVVPVP